MKELKNKKKLLVTLADENFVKQAKQLFSSVYWNAGWEGDYMLLAHEIPDEKLKWFKERNILVKQCQSIPTIQKDRDTKWPLTVFSKFYLFSPEFKKWDNIIFLDADMIVRASLDRLIEIKKFAAVKTIGWSLKYFFFCPKNKKDLYKNLIENYSLTENGFNTGLMVFNTSIIKKNTLSKLIYLAQLYNPLNFHSMEEPIFNLLFYKQWQKLPRVYNIYSDKTKGIIIHPVKSHYRPWDKASPLYKEWTNNLKKADLINLNQRPPAKEVWSNTKIGFYIIYLKIRDLFFYIFSQIDKLIGQFGLFLKKHWPKLYLQLKKLKKE